MNPLLHKVLMTSSQKAENAMGWRTTTIDVLSNSTATAAGVDHTGRLLVGGSTGRIGRYSSPTSWSTVPLQTYPDWGNNSITLIKSLRSITWVGGKASRLAKISGSVLENISVVTSVYGPGSVWSNTDEVLDVAASATYVVVAGTNGKLAISADGGNTFVNSAYGPWQALANNLGDIVSVIYKETPAYTGDETGWWFFSRSGAYAYTSSSDPSTANWTVYANPFVFSSNSRCYRVLFNDNQFVAWTTGGTTSGDVYISYTGVGGWNRIANLPDTTPVYKDFYHTGGSYVVLYTSGNNINLRVNNKIDNMTREFVSWDRETTGLTKAPNFINYHDGHYFLGAADGTIYYKQIIIPAVVKKVKKPLILNYDINGSSYGGVFYLSDVNVLNGSEDILIKVGNGNESGSRAANSSLSTWLRNPFNQYFNEGSHSYSFKQHYINFGSTTTGTVRIFYNKIDFFSLSGNTFLTEVVSWGNGQIKNLESSFSGCTRLTTLPNVSEADFSFLKSTAFMFQGCTNLNTSNVNKILEYGQNAAQAFTSVAGMFYGCTNFNQPIQNSSGQKLNLNYVKDFRAFMWGTKFNSSVKINWRYAGPIIEYNGATPVKIEQNFSGMFGLCTSLVGDSTFSDFDFRPMTEPVSTGTGPSFGVRLRLMFSQAYKFNIPTLNWQTKTTNNQQLIIDTFRMFYQAYEFNGDVSSFAMGECRDVSEMFYQASKFNNNASNLIRNWDVRKVELMSNMFWSAVVFDQPLDNWQPIKATNLSGMFYSAQAFNKPLWNKNYTSSFQNLSSMFYDAQKFNDSSVTDWNTSSVTNMSSMFRRAVEFNQPLNWDVSKVTDFSKMFGDAQKFNQNLTSWQILAATNLSNMFEYSLAFNNGNATGIAHTFNWQTPKVTNINMSYMFYNARAFNGNVGSWDVRAVTNLSFMFCVAQSFNNGENSSINNWQITSCVNASAMFASAIKFNQPLNGWGASTSKLIDTSGMFNFAVEFNQDLNAWDVSNVTDMAYMFSYAKKFNGNISSWRTGKVTSMKAMFKEAQVFNNVIDKSGDRWDTSNVTDMSEMFKNTPLFNNSLSGWNTSKVIDMSRMFEDAPKFNQFISLWDTSSVTTMYAMFRGATAFANGGILFNRHQSTTAGKVIGWDTSKVTDMGTMFLNAYFFEKFFNQTYDELLAGTPGLRRRQRLNQWCVPLIQPGSSQSFTFYADSTLYPLNPDPVWGTCPAVVNQEYTYVPNPNDPNDPNYVQTFDISGNNTTIYLRDYIISKGWNQSSKVVVDITGNIVSTYDGSSNQTDKYALFVLGRFPRGITINNYGTIAGRGGRGGQGGRPGEPGGTGTTGGNGLYLSPTGYDPIVFNNYGTIAGGGGGQGGGAGAGAAGEGSSYVYGANSKYGAARGLYRWGYAGGAAGAGGLNPDGSWSDGEAHTPLNNGSYEFFGYPGRPAYQIPTPDGDTRWDRFDNVACAYQIRYVPGHGEINCFVPLAGIGGIYNYTFYGETGNVGYYPDAFGNPVVAIYSDGRKEGIFSWKPGYPGGAGGSPGQAIYESGRVTWPRGRGTVKGLIVSNLY